MERILCHGRIKHKTILVSEIIGYLFASMHDITTFVP